MIQSDFSRISEKISKICCQDIEDKPVRHEVLTTEYDEKIPTADQAADRFPVLLHPHSMSGWLKTLNKYFFIGTNQISVLMEIEKIKSVICA